MTISLLYFVLVLSSSLLLAPLIEATDYILAFQWNPAVCNKDPRCATKSFPRTLTVHGLWLQGTGDRYCTDGPNYEQAFMIPIRDDLKNIWMNAESGTDEDFWRQEWRKHGRCSRFRQRDYFQHVMDLFNYHDFRTVVVNFFEKGVTQRDLLIQTLNTILGKTTQMICVRNNQLLEIRLRYNYLAGTGFRGWTLEDSYTRRQNCTPGDVRLQQI